MRRIVMVSVLSVMGCLALPAAGQEISFQKIVVDKTFRSEGVAVGDIDHDGKMDIFAGDVWYQGPDWKMHELRPVGKYEPMKGYSKCFANFAMDVNGDGWIDSIVIGYPGDKCLWYENPKDAAAKPGHWKERVLASSACNETPLFADLLGNGKPVLLFGLKPEQRLAWLSLPKDTEGLWDVHLISEPKTPAAAQYGHGLGVGDVNGDGRNDVIATAGWWEAPEDRTQGPWKFHPARLGPDCADMHAYDVDGDGLNDIISSSAHNYGIWWHKQVKTDKGVEFQQNLITKEFSQPHALHLVDINGDGVKDLVTGKRWMAHMGGDPGEFDRPVLVIWYELRRPEKGKVEFIPHKIDEDSGVGTQFVVTDLNGDGKPDIVTSNKKGVRLFLQQPAIKPAAEGKP